MRSPSFVCLLCVASLASSCLSKSDTWKVGAIPDAQSFLILTPMEHRRDSMAETFHQRHLATFADGSAFVEKYPDSVLQKFVQQEMALYRSLRNNRARFRNRSERNGKPDPEGMFREAGEARTDCSCVLTENGLVRIQAAQWLFGGFSLEMEVEKSGRFQSGFWEDQHKRPVFKKILSDSSLRDGVQVDNAFQDLVFAMKPTFAPEERLLGRLAFKTAPYFRSSEFQASFSKEGGYSAAKMDTVRTSGVMDFACELKACAPADSVTRWNRANNPRWSGDPCR